MPSSPRVSFGPRHGENFYFHGGRGNFTRRPPLEAEWVSPDRRGWKGGDALKRQAETRKQGRGAERRRNRRVLRVHVKNRNLLFFEVFYK